MTLSMFILKNIPRGTIILWSGSIASIPDGYHLCDGTNGTPDLKNQFVVCADADVVGTAMTTITGGTQQTGGAVTTDNGYASITDTGHNHENGYTVGVDYGGDENVWVEGWSANNMTGITDGGHYHGIVPPFFALAYIQKL